MRVRDTIRWHSAKEIPTIEYVAHNISNNLNKCIREVTVTVYNNGFINFNAKNLSEFVRKYEDKNTIAHELDSDYNVQQDTVISISSAPKYKISSFRQK